MALGRCVDIWDYELVAEWYQVCLRLHFFPFQGTGHIGAENSCGRSTCFDSARKELSGCILLTGALTEVALSA